MKRDVERELVLDALPIGRPNLESYHMDYTLFYLYLVHLGSIFLWILFQAYLGHKMVGIQFLWLLISFLRWHISYLVIKLMMQPTLLICSLDRQYSSMVFLRVLCMIMMLSSLAIFGKSCGESWELNYCFRLLVTPKRMDKLRQ